VAAHIATFNPLTPPGYTFRTGIELFQVYTLIAEHLPDRQTVFLISYPIAQGDPHTIVDSISQNSFQAQPVGAHFNSIASKGELDVANQKMPYVSGTLSDQEGTVEGMFGCLVSKNLNRTISVLALAPAGKHFDMGVTINLLKCIEKFN
jgi:hypothetical protein